MPVLLRNRRLADGAGSVAMQPVSASNIGDGGDDLRGQLESHCAFGSRRWWYVTNHFHAYQCARPRNAFLAWAVIRPPGLGCTSCGAPSMRPRDLLGGAVEVDETYVGGRETGVVGRQTKTKSIVAIAAEVRGRSTGRIRMSRVEDVAARSLIPFVQTTVAPGATVRTDGWSAYSGLANQGYDRQRDPFPPVATRPTSSCHECIAWPLCLIAGGWASTMVPSIDASRLLSREFTFRFNRRRSQARGLLSSDCSSRRCSTSRSPTRA